MLAKTLTPKGVDCEIPHWLERGTSVSKAGLRREVDYEIPHHWIEEQNILYKGVEPSKGETQITSQTRTITPFFIREACQKQYHLQK